MQSSLCSSRFTTDRRGGKKYAIGPRLSELFPKCLTSWSERSDKTQVSLSAAPYPCGGCPSGTRGTWAAARQCSRRSHPAQRPPRSAAASWVWLGLSKPTSGRGLGKRKIKEMRPQNFKSPQHLTEFFSKGQFSPKGELLKYWFNCNF